jgi:protocatechuate 3,4-dioxygenase beta subunit
LELAAPANQKLPTSNQVALKKNNTNDQDTTTLHGQVFGPDGKPFANAKLYLIGSDDKDTAGKAVRATTDKDGRFQFGVSNEKLSRDRMQLVALTEGCGPAWVKLAKDSGELQLRLPADLSIRGKVVDLEGKPVAGVSIRVVELSSPQSGVLDEFLSQWAKDKEKSRTGPVFQLLTEKYLGSPEALLRRSTSLTGPDGTFVLTGIGRDRGLLLGIRGPGIADQYVRVLTRPDFSAPPAAKGQVDFSGPQPITAVAPSKPILGTLRDARTKEPVAGIRVLAYTPDRPLHWSGKPIETVTDAQGNYRLDGLAKSARQIVTFNPVADSPYMHRFDEIRDTPGFTPVTHDSEFYRGIIVSGRVIDRRTGRPVRAYVTYAPLLNNRDFTSTPGYAGPPSSFQIWITDCETATDADGRYRVTALPGPGALFVRTADDSKLYTRPNVAREDQDPAIYDKSAERFKTRGGGGLHFLANLNAYRLIKPTADASELTADFALDSGVSRRGRLLDPEGRPLFGVEAFNLNPNYPRTPEYGSIVLKNAEFTAEALNLAKGRRLLFWHHERKLAGTVVLRGDEPEPVLITLQPLAAIAGRVTNLKGEPLAAYPVKAHAHPGVFWPKQEMRPKNPPVLTDKDGRFRLPELPAGVPLGFMVLAQHTPFAFVHRENIVLEPGQTKDLGDLRGDPGDQ